MGYRVDEKGKVFTPHISKHGVAVTAYVRDLIIHGTVHLTPDNRLKDELNSGERFIAITDAHVFQVGSEQFLYESSVLIINKDQVIFIFPCESAPAPTEPASEQ